MSAVVQPKGSDTTAVRPFEMKPFPDADLAELRRRINATRWPERETVTDASQGVQLATTQKLARYWATDYDWRKCEARLECAAELHHRDRWARHSFHSRAFEARKRVAAHRHARMARLGRRAAEDHRSAHQSHGAWRERIGRFRSSSSRRCRATASRASRPRPAGAPIVSRVPGSC